MNKLLLLTFALLFNFVTVLGQTTEEEYNYLTKGYQLDKETGRDIKSGYEIEEIHKGSSSINVGGKTIYRRTKVYRFIKIDESRTVALLFEFKRADTNYSRFVCLPSADSDQAILSKSQSDFFDDESIDGNNAQYVQYLWATMKALGEYVMQNDNLIEQE